MRSIGSFRLPSVACVSFFVAIMIVAPRQAMAELLTFTDRSLWEVAVADFVEETFNSFTTDQSFNDGATVNVGPFALTGFGNASLQGEMFNRIDAAPFSPFLGSLNGTTDIAARVFDFGSNPRQGFHITFAQPIVAWGADWGVLASSFRVSVDDAVVGKAVDNSFFGVVDTTGSFTNITIDTPSGFGGATTHMDNFVFSLLVEPPEDLINNLIEDVEALGLSATSESQLVKKLTDALSKLDAGKSNGAIDKLDGFINKVTDLLGNGELDQGIANHLIEEANALIDAINAT